MAKHRGIWPLSWLCEALDVSRGGYYSWLKRPPSAHDQRDEELLTSVRCAALATVTELMVRVGCVGTCAPGASHAGFTGLSG